MHSSRNSRPIKASLGHHSVANCRTLRGLCLCGLMTSSQELSRTTTCFGMYRDTNVTEHELKKERQNIKSQAQQATLQEIQGRARHESRQICAAQRSEIFDAASPLCAQFGIPLVSRSKSCLSPSVNRLDSSRKTYRANAEVICPPPPLLPP